MKLTTVLALGCILAFAGRAVADPGLSSEHFIESLHKADFIFEGVVTAVDYKSSRATGAGQRPMPHTFVTFEIRKVYKGNPGSLMSITLRFLGGATAAGRILEVSMYPLFDVGDHDILMVERNTKKSCPLTSCAQGRFRIIDDLVYSDLGNEMDLTPEGALAYGPEHRLPEIDTDMVGGHRMAKVMLEEDARGVLVPPPQLSPPAGWRHMTGGVFDTFLEATLSANLTHGELTRNDPVVSADIRDDFVFALLRQALPNSDPPGLKFPPEAITTIQEQLEADLFKANGGDPRL
jgi:hypothetical protein